ncbi:MAG TPA: FAD-binding oxidoreductase [Flexivirga sp.]|uniref:FAD-binding oxidoreductase n=1 Tax=Flexivirga sp. TaxID=1962927 RepID=UPI002C0672C4|nr:FAD-binding oxidoreductase [Flexivirga sp.]HWC23249.1 FAD-binding oxidoreductase [Flexivirga sp.]
MLVALADSLRPSIAGRVLVPNDADWADATSGFNLAVTQQPDIVVVAAHAEDVVQAVRFAGEQGLPIGVQATGHGAAVPVEGGVLINTSRLTDLDLDPDRGTARVAAGVRWQQVIDAAAPHGLAPLNGSSTTVGVVGYTLGGGFGPMARTFGFAADRVRRLRLVTADGAVHEVTAESEPDLFWGLRGGKCQLGIVTELDFELMPLAHYYGGGLFFDGEDAPAVLHAWREWAGQLSDRANTSIALLRLPDLPGVPEPLRGRLTVHLRFLYVGGPEEGERELAPIRAVAAALIDTVAVTPYSAIASVHCDPTDPLPVWDTSCLLTEFPAAAVDALLDVAGPGNDVPLIVAEIRPMGGALATAQGTDNAVGGREAAFNAYAVGVLPPPLVDVTPAAGRAFVDALAPWATGGTLINFHGCDTRRPVDAWSGATRERLDALHQQHDPQGSFRFAQPHSRRR